MIETLRQRYGAAWARDEDANLRFSVDAEHLLRDFDGAHLIGEPELDDGAVTISMWVDRPIRDLTMADKLAYDVFARLSLEVFYTERRFEAKAVRYPFVTGSAHQGHIGAVILAGPHAAEFADRHHTRITGGLRYQA